MDIQTSKNPVLSHAVRGSSTSAPSGNSLSATAAAENTGFCFSEYELRVAEIMWRINIQIIAIQLGDYKAANSEEEKILWKTRIWESLCRLNQKAQLFNPALLPSDIPAPTEEYRALSVTGNWCLQLTKELTYLFTNAYPADTSRTEAITPIPLVLSAAESGDMSIIKGDF